MKNKLMPVALTVLSMAVAVLLYVIRAEALAATREIDTRLSIQEALLPRISNDVAEIKGDVKHIQYLIYKDRFDRSLSEYEPDVQMELEKGKR